MKWITGHIKWIMLISGVVTCTMLYAVVSPAAATLMMFGESPDGVLAGIIVRNWAALITLVGVMLIYGAYVAQVRTLVICVAVVSKFFFVSLFLVSGNQYLVKAGPSVTFDTIVIVILCLYLVDVYRARHSS